MKILLNIFICLLFIAAAHSSGLIVSDTTDDSIKNEEAADSSGLIVSNTTDDSTEKKKDSNGEEGNAEFTFLAYLPKTKGEARFFGGGNSYGSRRKLEIGNRRSTWRDAMSSCYERDGVLVSIDNADLDRTVRYALIARNINERVWTSGRFAYTGEPRHLYLFMWAGNGQEFDYTNWIRWYGQEPSAIYDVDTCVTVAQSGFYESQYKWDMSYCEEELRFICVV